MKYQWATDFKPKLIEVSVQSKFPQTIILSVGDADRPHSLYYYQETEVAPSDTVPFEISLPLTPKKAFFEIHPKIEQEGLSTWNIGNNASLTFEIKEFPFQQKCAVSKSALIKSFLSFSSWFSMNAGVLKASYDKSGLYTSPDGTFVVQYVPEILDDEPFYIVGNQKVANSNFGKPLPTSFRVHNYSKKMELSQKYVLDYTIPQRMVLFAHEFAHGWLNNDPDSEFEADYNSLLICRCAGFSKREIADGYTKVFFRYASDENMARWQKIKETLNQMK